ncbi:MAG: DNA-binding protein [Nitrospiraceae bacterium]|nr:MAG: DNA-binding protein [Nitrospiraceae bacterium]
MNYQTGKPGRIIVAKFDDHDDVLENLADIARKENIRAAVLYLVGGMRQGRIVVGPESETLPPQPVWKELGESHEVIGLGTIFWQGDEPKIHMHGAFGKKDMVKIGCLREGSETFLVLEAIIMEMEGISAVREIDPAVGMALLKLKTDSSQ